MASDGSKLMPADLLAKLHAKLTGQHCSTSPAAPSVGGRSHITPSPLTQVANDLRDSRHHVAQAAQRAMNVSVDAQESSDHSRSGDRELRVRFDGAVGDALHANSAQLRMQRNGKTPDASGDQLITSSSSPGGASNPFDYNNSRIPAAHQSRHHTPLQKAAGQVIEASVRGSHEQPNSAVVVPRQPPTRNANAPDSTAAQAAARDGGQDAADEIRPCFEFHTAETSSSSSSAGAGGGSSTSSSAADSAIPLSDHHRIPGSIARHLRPYQIQGVRWMYSRLQQSKGCILGDDMGLGKTIQVIALIASLLGKTGHRSNDVPATRRQRAEVQQLIKSASSTASKASASAGTSSSSSEAATSASSAAPTAVPAFPSLVSDHLGTLPILILAPSSLLAQWKQELETWAFVDVALANSDRETKIRLVAETGQGLHAVLIMTPESACSLQDEILAARRNNGGWPWGLVVCDEAHNYFRNPKTQAYQFLQKLRPRARLACTGTPMQNDLDEVYNLLDVIIPGCAGARKEFKEYYSKPIEKSIAREHTARDLAVGQVRQEQFMKQIFAANVLQRKKSEVLSASLPKKSELVVYCKLSTLQERAYKAAIASADFQAILGTAGGNDHVDAGPLWHGNHLDGRPCDSCDGYRCIFFPCLGKLQAISNHLELLKPLGAEYDAADEGKRAHQWEFMESILGPGGMTAVGGREPGRLEHVTATETCGKLQLLRKMLDHFDSKPEEKHKVIIFSQSKRLLKCLALWLQDKYRGRYLTYDGDVNGRDRSELVHRFNTEERIFIMLLTVQSGGVGLNLVAADNVILFDPNWNPAVDQQAQDRAYRIGQTRDVKVYRLLTQGTIEETMYLRQTWKVHLGQRALSNSVASRIFTAEDISGTAVLLRYTSGGLTSVLWNRYAASVKAFSSSNRRTSNAAGGGQAGTTVSSSSAPSSSSSAAAPAVVADDVSDDPTSFASDPVASTLAAGLLPQHVDGGWTEAPDMLAQARDAKLQQQQGPPAATAVVGGGGYETDVIADIDAVDSAALEDGSQVIASQGAPTGSGSSSAGAASNRSSAVPALRDQPLDEHDFYGPSRSSASGYVPSITRLNHRAADDDHIVNVDDDGFERPEGDDDDAEPAPYDEELAEAAAGAAGDAMMHSQLAFGEFHDGGGMDGGGDDDGDGPHDDEEPSAAGAAATVKRNRDEPTAAPEGDCEMDGEKDGGGVAVAGHLKSGDTLEQLLAGPDVASTIPYNRFVQASETEKQRDKWAAERFAREREEMIAGLISRGASAAVIEAVVRGITESGGRGDGQAAATASGTSGGVDRGYIERVLGDHTHLDAAAATSSNVPAASSSSNGVPTAIAAASRGSATAASTTVGSASGAAPTSRAPGSRVLPAGLSATSGAAHGASTNARKGRGKKQTALPYGALIRPKSATGDRDRIGNAVSNRGAGSDAAVDLTPDSDSDDDGSADHDDGDGQDGEVVLVSGAGSNQSGAVAGSGTTSAAHTNHGDGETHDDDEQVDDIAAVVPTSQSSVPASSVDIDLVPTQPASQPPEQQRASTAPQVAAGVAASGSDGPNGARAGDGDAATTAGSRDHGAPASAAAGAGSAPPSAAQPSRRRRRRDEEDEEALIAQDEARLRDRKRIRQLEKDRQRAVEAEVQVVSALPCAGDGVGAGRTIASAARPGNGVSYRSSQQAAAADPDAGAGDCGAVQAHPAPAGIGSHADGIASSAANDAASHVSCDGGIGLETDAATSTGAVDVHVHRIAAASEGSDHQPNGAHQGPMQLQLSACLGPDSTDDDDDAESAGGQDLELE